MKHKLLIGVGAAVVVLAATAFAGIEWLRYRVEREVAARFAALSTTIDGPASYGQARFSPWTRTIRISDVSLQGNPKVMPPTKIAELVVAGVPLTPGDRITARRVDLTRTDVTVDAAKTIHIDGVTIDDLDVSRQIAWQRLRAAAESGPPRPGQPPKDALLAVADALDGIRFSRLEMRDLAFRESGKGIDVASVRLDGLPDGRFAEMSVRGVSSVALPNKVHIGRVAFNKLDLAGFFRKSAQLGTPNRPPTPEEMAAFAAMLEGIEMEDILIPDERPGHAPGDLMHLVSAQASWGRFVGLMPTTARYAAKAEMPLNEAAEPFQALRDAGRKSLTFAFDLGSTWSEQSRTLVLNPAIFDMDDLFSTSLTLSVANVSPNVMVFQDQAKLVAAAAALEAGPVELSFRDSGGLDFVVAQAAKTQNISVGEARTKIVDDLKRNASMLPQQSPELQRLVDALGSFLSGSGGTLKISLKPRGRVNVLQTVELIKIDPIAALSQFAVEAAVVGR